MIISLIPVFLLLLLSSWLCYRHQTRFRTLVETTDKTLVIRIKRRFFYSWPESIVARNVHYKSEKRFVLKDNTGFTLPAIKITDPDADEKLADRVTEAKEWLALCKNQNLETREFKRVAQKMLKD